MFKAIQTVRSQNGGGGVVGIASIWDLFTLDDAPQWGRSSELGEVLTRLDAKTLAKVRDWLDGNVEEAVRRNGGESQCVNLYAAVRTLAWLSALPPDKPLVPEKRDTGLPLEIMGYTRRGRGVDQTLVISLARLRQAPHHFSERDYEKILGIPRSTIRHMVERMDEIEFSLNRFTADDLAYVAFGNPRGRKHNH